MRTSPLVVFDKLGAQRHVVLDMHTLLGATSSYTSIVQKYE